VLSFYTLLLGLGLGMVMQVLVLAVQNAVAYRDLGAATAGTTLFRLIGGSLGVSLFGAIFAAGLHRELARRLPDGTAPAGLGDPAALAALPAAVRDAYAASFAAALHPVFLVAAVLAAVAFALCLLLREVPLRRSVEAQGPGEALAMLRDADSLRELERIVCTLARRENRWRAYDRLAGRAGLALDAQEIWLLGQIAFRPAADAADLGRRLRTDPTALAGPLERLRGRGYLTEGAVAPSDAGRAAAERLTAARRAGLAELLDGWAPDQHAEVEALLDRLARTLVSEMPAMPAA
jgi:DNA-binding MarR family transcriptional regulator